MNDLINALEHRAARGMPRGADAVFDAAVQAAQSTGPTTVGVSALSPSQPSDTSDDLVVTGGPPHAGTPRRLTKIMLTAAACGALLATGIVIANRVGDDSNGGELNELNPDEALPLASAALITPDEIGTRWRQQDTYTEADYAAKTEATRAVVPDCDVLAAVGLLPPTTKSVSARRTFTMGQAVDVNHTVFVFATPEDASRAMDIIEGTSFMTCWFSLIDRLAPLARFAIESATSQAWEAPPIAPHGDRQIIIGQLTSYESAGGPFEAHIINSFVQVGRAISWIAPAFGVEASDPSVLTNKVLAAAASRLEASFGS